VRVQKRKQCDLSEISSLLMQDASCTDGLLH
jgi:hypothetical protein